MQSYSCTRRPTSAAAVSSETVTENSNLSDAEGRREDGENKNTQSERHAHPYTLDLGGGVTIGCTGCSDGSGNDPHFIRGLPELPPTTDPWRIAQTCPVTTSLSLTELVRTVITALKEERDWQILRFVLESIPKMLENKALIMSRYSNDIDYFAMPLFRMVSSKGSV